MKWMEMIRVRSSASGVEEIMRYIAPRLPLLRGNGKGLDGAYVLVHGQYEGDLAFILVWDNDCPPAKSREGILLAEYFTKHGPVGHGIWTLATEWRASGERPGHPPVVEKRTVPAKS